MKTKEELDAIKGEVEALYKKLAELSEDELKAVAGGGSDPCSGCPRSRSCGLEPEQCGRR